jgi:hypothetical protein
LIEQFVNYWQLRFEGKEKIFNKSIIEQETFSQRR